MVTLVFSFIDKLVGHVSLHCFLKSILSFLFHLFQDLTKAINKNIEHDLAVRASNVDTKSFKVIQTPAEATKKKGNK